jgi:ATP adenylyltransferase
MERLWTPWRMEYIQGVHEAEGCIFCDLPSAGDDERVYILGRGALAFVVLNAYPYNPGHLMVAPFRHVGEFEELDEDEWEDIGRLLRRSVVAIKAAADPAGFNVGMNLGRVAGAGIPDHLHWHVVPRWSGDTNFMSIVGETRVLPELLAETYAKLKPQF